MTPRLLSTTEVARLLGVPRYQVVRWIRAGALPAKRIGRRWWISSAALDRFLDNDSGGDWSP